MKDKLGDPISQNDRCQRPNIDEGAILVVAEHRAHRQSLAMLLRSFGLSAHAVATVGAILQDRRHADGPPPRCAIIDLYHLKEPLSVCLERIDEYSGPMPVLLLAGLWRSVDHQILQNRSAAAAVLVKPYEPPALLDALDHLLGDDASSMAPLGFIRT